MPISIHSHDALLVVDMQNDFLPGGSLAVPGSAAIIPKVNGYIQLFIKAKLPVFASRDYHPEDHMSFSHAGGPWPPHCIAGNSGARFHPDLELPDEAIIVSKGENADREAYSAVDSTPLAVHLEELNISRVFVCGLATDYCVFASAKDLLQAGYTVIVLTDAIKAVDVQPGDGNKALAELVKLGAKQMQKDDISP